MTAQGFTTMPIRNRLKALMDEREINRTELHFRTRLDKRTIAKWEKNQVKSFEPDVIEALCKALGCEPGDLLVRVEE